MGVYNASWEDEENNRTVGISVDYRVDEETVVIENVTPKSVTFHCPTSGETLRKIGVHTAGGRRVLARQISNNVCLDRLADEVNQSLLA